MREIRDPARTYPRATAIAITMIVALLVPATLAIAVLVPSGEISTTAGVVQAMEVGVERVWGVGWLVPVFALAIYLDAIGEIAAAPEAIRLGRSCTVRARFVRNPTPGNARLPLLRSANRQ